jgi:phosphoenolpyruvate carboxylase
MCTQHPDSTIKVTAEEEVDEAIAAYSVFGCDEVMSDFEGKATPYIQPRDIVVKAAKLGLPLGERFFVTPRIPNPRLEDFERAMLALEAAVLADLRAYRELGRHAVKWVILPMAEDADTVRLTADLLLRKAEAYSEKAEIQLVPLVEDAERQLRIADYIKAVSSEYIKRGLYLEEIRVFLGKSDSAVKHGHVASSLAIRLALLRINALNSEWDHRALPILGMGSPPFRGGLNNPALAELEALQYAGFATATIQSAVRYDVPYEKYLKVKSALQAPQQAPRPLPFAEEEAVGLIRRASESYRALVVKYAPNIAEVAQLIPSTRDRVSWRIYGRSIINGENVVNVPRAIVYTASWYALGLPPTFLDAPFLLEARRRGELDALLKALPALEAELRLDAEYYDRRRAEEALGPQLVRPVDELLDALGIRSEARAEPPFAPSAAYILAEARTRGFLG